jgi:hypothetical protein
LVLGSALAAAPVVWAASDAVVMVGGQPQAPGRLRLQLSRIGTEVQR